MVQFLSAVPAADMARRSGIDFNILDSMAGGFIVFLVMCLFLYFCFKWGVLSFKGDAAQAAITSNPAIVRFEMCPAHAAEHERSLENKEKIGELFRRTLATENSIGAIKIDLAQVKAGNEAILREISKLTK